MACNFLLVWAFYFLAQAHVSLQQSGPAPVPAEIFPLIKQRLELAIDVALVKYKTCKNIEDLAREAQILENITSIGVTQHNISKEDVQMFYKTQIQANKMIQYSSVILQEANFKSRPVQTLDSIRVKITELDNKILPLIKPNIESFKAMKDKESCLQAINSAVDTKQLTFPVAAFHEACALFVEICLKATVCKV